MRDALEPVDDDRIAVDVLTMFPSGSGHLNRQAVVPVFTFKLLMLLTIQLSAILTWEMLKKDDNNHIHWPTSLDAATTSQAIV